MHIALYHWGRLPPTDYGGTERVVTWLARGLAELGHQVTLIAGRGSVVPAATVIEVDPAAAKAPQFDLRPLLPKGVEILLASASVRNDPGVPYIAQLHGNSTPGTTRRPNTLFLSADHARRHGATAYVYNGIDPDELLFRPSKKAFDLFLGRLHREKGWQWAVTGARQLGRDLVVAGGWRPSFSRRLRFVGKVGGREKAELLADARLLWMPALWDEPFGLTLVEALASGTPVLGTTRGSLPEIITPDVGRLGATLDELIAAVEGLRAIDPEACRARVLRHFHYRVMAAGQLRMAEEYLRTGVLPPGKLLDAGELGVA
jgi:glycosyltransferase involved in cell wall biosynthesis